jgi:hypothetical protein
MTNKFFDFFCLLIIKKYFTFSIYYGHKNYIIRSYYISIVMKLPTPNKIDYNNIKNWLSP